MFPGTSPVVPLSQRKPDDVIKIDLDLDELETSSPESKATYERIKDYVLTPNSHPSRNRQPQLIQKLLSFAGNF